MISDNLTTAMTGGQDSAGTNKFEAICLGLGVEPAHVRVAVSYTHLDVYKRQGLSLYR